MYTLVEFQTNNGVTAVVQPVVFQTRNDAEAAYHTVLAAAAVSSVEIHACTVLNECGVAVLNQVYYHEKN